MNVFEMEAKIREMLGHEEMVQGLLGNMWDWEIDEALGYISMKYDIDRSNHNGKRKALLKEAKRFQEIIGTEGMVFDLTHEMIEPSLENTLELVIEYCNLEV